MYCLNNRMVKRRNVSGCDLIVFQAGSDSTCAGFEGNILSKNMLQEKYQVFFLYFCKSRPTYCSLIIEVGKMLKWANAFLSILDKNTTYVEYGHFNIRYTYFTKVVYETRR